MTGDESKERNKCEDCSCHADRVEGDERGDGIEGKEAQQWEVEKTSIGRKNVGAAEVAVGKRGYEDTEEGRCPKYRRAAVDVEEEEGLWEIDPDMGSIYMKHGCGAQCEKVVLLFRTSQCGTGCGY